MPNEPVTKIRLRRFAKADMEAVLGLVAQIASGEDLTESAGQQFANELANPQFEGGAICRHSRRTGDRDDGLRRRSDPLEVCPVGGLVDC